MGGGGSLETVARGGDIAGEDQKRALVHGFQCRGALRVAEEKGELI
jgi:hypothetical protein